MSRSRAAFFTALVGAAVVVGVPLLSAGTAGAAPDQPPTTSTVATTDGHDWDD